MGVSNNFFCFRQNRTKNIVEQKEVLE